MPKFAKKHSRISQRLNKSGISQHIEDKLILEVAKQIDIKHLLILKKVKLKQNKLLGLAVLENNHQKYEKQINSYQNILDVFRMEQLAGAHNPYSVDANRQRLYYMNRGVLTKIKKLRKLKLDQKEKDELINLEYSQLEKKLRFDYETILKELLDINNRKQAYHEIMLARYAAKKLRFVKEDADDDYYYVNLTTSLGETIAGITRTILLATRHARHLSQAMPIIGAACVLISTLASIITLKPCDLEGHKLFNSLTTIVAGLVDTAGYFYTTMQDFLPAIADKIGWVPFLGTALTWMMLGVEIINLIYLEIRYKKELKALNSICSNSMQLSDMSWLFENNMKGLTCEQKKFKRVFERHVSTAKLSEHDKQLILHLFKSDQFEDILKPTLIEHIKNERYKRLWRHAINVVIMAIFVTSGLVSILFPIAAPIIAVALIGFVIATTIAKMSIFNTVLKEQRITIEKLIPEEYALTFKLEEQKDLAHGLRAGRGQTAKNTSQHSPNIVQKLCRFFINKPDSPENEGGRPFSFRSFN